MLSPNEMTVLANSLDSEVRRRLLVATTARHFGTSADVDTNHDGHISKAELSQWMRRDVFKALGDSEEHARKAEAKLAKESESESGDKKDEDKEDTVPAPTNGQLFLLATTVGVPFIGFGFMDNSIMLLAGEAIDYYICDSMGFGPLISAALGNIVAAWASLTMGKFLDHLFMEMGLANKHGLTSRQHRLRIAQLAGLLGSMVGITIGMLLGMFPIAIFGDGDEDAGHGGKKKK